ncbi:MAG: hypothetical protein KC643_14155, partial [Nitrospira sp.]|nr:hypothetical protein [Nitrospira sp.]
MAHGFTETRVNCSSKDTSSIAYILMEYPRISESFIINEIYQLEQLGLSLHLFSVKQPKDSKVHN